VVRLPVEFGGFTALAGLALLLLVTINLRNVSTLSGRSPPELGATAALVAIAVQAVVDDPSHWPAVYLLASVFLGALLAVPARPAASLLKPSRFVAATLLLLVFFVGEVGTWQAHRLVSELPDGRLSRKQISQLKRAQRLNPVQPSYHMRLAEAAMTNRMNWTLDDYSRARIDAETAIRLHPAESKYHWTLARVEGRGCRELFRDLKSRDRAYGEFRLAQQLAPYDVRISLQAGAFALSVADPLTARERAEYALELEPNAVPGHLLLAEIELNSLADDLDQVDKHLQTAMTIAAENPPNRLSTSYERQLLDMDNDRLAAITRRMTERRGMATQ